MISRDGPNDGGSGSNGNDGNSSDKITSETLCTALIEEKTNELEVQRWERELLEKATDDDGLEKGLADTTQDQRLNPTKQMTEIRSLLCKIDLVSLHLTLPLIVVIGSRSFGKSSVLDALVGKDFLPKGYNLITRTPSELTLVNILNSPEITANFPLQELHNLKDFKEVRRILMKLNMSVPSLQVFSEKLPPQLTIKSFNVANLFFFKRFTGLLSSRGCRSTHRIKK